MKQVKKLGKRSMVALSVAIPLAVIPLAFNLYATNAAGTNGNTPSSHSIEMNEQVNSPQVISATLSDKGEHREVNVTYPQLTGLNNEKVQKAINQFLKEEAEKHTQSANEKLLEQVASMNENGFLSLGGVSIIVTLDSSYEVTYNEQGKLSLYVDYDMYLGGAHNGRTWVPYTFDLSTGKLISLKDATSNDNFVAIIDDFIHKEIVKRALPMDYEFKGITPDRDYYLTKQGVVVYFNEYEYLPYAEGITEFEIPYSAFK